MPNSCDVNDANSLGGLVVDPRDAIEVLGGKDITVDKQTFEGKTIFTVNYQAFAPPTITSNSGIYKVGITVPSFVFNAEIRKGSNDIVSRSMTPDIGLNLEAPFNWTETDILGTSPGLWPRFDGSPTVISCMDSIGTVVNRNVGIEYRHLFYMGYSIKDTLNESEIKAFTDKTLLLDIKSRFGSFAYNYTEEPVYIYWVYPSDSPAISGALEGPLPVPLTYLNPINITDEGVQKSYNVVRTAVKTTFSNATINLR